MTDNWRIAVECHHYPVFLKNVYVTFLVTLNSELCSCINMSSKCVLMYTNDGVTLNACNGH